MNKTTGKRPVRRRLSKAALLRVKIAAIGLSVVAFFGGLAGVVIANPATHSANLARSASQPAIIAQQPAIQPPTDFQPQLGGAPLVMPTQPQMPFLRPLTRSRGS